MVLADAFDAMTTNRIYKGNKEVKEVMAELIELSGKQFHPEVVKSAVRVLSNIEIKSTLNQFPTTEVEKERFAYFYRDQLTNAYNSEYLNIILSRNIIEKEYCFIDTLYLNNFNNYNQKNSWEEGDKLLNKVCNTLYEHFPSSLIFRVHGDDFVIINKDNKEIDFSSIELLRTMEEKHHIETNTHRISIAKEAISCLSDLEEIMFSS